MGKTGIELPLWVRKEMTLEQAYEDPRPMADFNPVTKPMHYVQGRKYEPVKVINDWELNFNLGNVVKYVSRAGRKNNKKQDLEKALFYLQQEIERC